MKRLIPKFLKYPLIALYIKVRCLMRGRASEGVVLNLAGVLPQDPEAIIHGGKVKLLTLRERFGDSWKHFNIAYFASSGLPFAPALWLKTYKFFGIKSVWNQNGFAYPALYPKEVVGRINGLMKPMHLADHVIFQTAFTKRCADKFLGEYKGQSEVLINPVDTNEFKPRKYPLPEEPLVIVMSGHHFESKERLDVSLESIRRLMERGLNVKLIVIGNTQELPEEEWIEIKGKFTREEAPELFKHAHLLLHLKALDPCPNIVLEALSSGLPVVGLGNGGMPELVDEKSGVLISAPENFERFHYPTPDEVANAIMTVRGNLHSLSQGARSRALQFDKEIWLKRHEEIFNSLLKK